MTRVLIADDHALFRAGLTPVPRGRAAFGRDWRSGVRQRGPELPAAPRLGHVDPRHQHARPYRSRHPAAREVGASCHARPRALGLTRAPVRAERTAGGRRGLPSRRTPPRRISSRPCAWCCRAVATSATAWRNCWCSTWTRADKPLHRPAFRPGVPDLRQAGRRTGGFRDRPRALPVREDRQYLSDTHPGKDANEEQCGPDQLCTAKRNHPVATPTSVA